MPVLESQSLNRTSDRTPMFFGGQSRSSGHPGVSHYVHAYNRRLASSVTSSVVIHSLPLPALPANLDEPVRRDGMHGLLMRGFDIVVAAAALVVLLPVMFVIACIVKYTSPGPAIFRQQRVGRDGVYFPCLKFRSMVVDAQAQLDRLLAESDDARAEWARDQKLRNDPRITPIGDFLRRTSLDELPQLINILAGQMSVVGPRPIVTDEIVRYGSRFEDYCSVRPGLTGLWQISGRNDVSYGMRVRLDSFYAHRQSLALNIAICFKTVPAILTSRGCY